MYILGGTILILYILVLYCIHSYDDDAQNQRQEESTHGSPTEQERAPLIVEAAQDLPQQPITIRQRGPLFDEWDMV